MYDCKCANCITGTVIYEPIKDEKKTVVYCFQCGRNYSNGYKNDIVPFVKFINSDLSQRKNCEYEGEAYDVAVDTDDYTRI